MTPSTSQLIRNPKEALEDHALTVSDMPLSAVTWISADTICTVVIISNKHSLYTFQITQHNGHTTTTAYANFLRHCQSLYRGSSLGSGFTLRKNKRLGAIDSKKRKKHRDMHQWKKKTIKTVTSWKITSWSASSSQFLSRCSLENPVEQFFIFDMAFGNSPDKVDLLLCEYVLVFSYCTFAEKDPFFGHNRDPNVTLLVSNLSPKFKLVFVILHPLKWAVSYDGILFLLTQIGFKELCQRVDSRRQIPFHIRKVPDEHIWLISDGPNRAAKVPQWHEDTMGNHVRCVLDVWEKRLPRRMLGWTLSGLETRLGIFSIHIRILCA